MPNDGNVTIVVPTRNRAYTLALVLKTHFEQPAVTEIIIVDDAGTDETRAVVESFSDRYQAVRTVYLRNQVRKGAGYCRMRGVEASSGEFVLFCDDDDFLGPAYARVCRTKLEQHGASIVSGRHFYRLPNEEIDTAIRRFGTGLVEQKPFDVLRFRVNTDACFKGDIEVPFTHGIFMTRRSLLLQYGFDVTYAKGNGFREESDMQMRAFLDGHKVVVTNDAHAVHLNMSEVPSGGQRVNRLLRYYWTVYYTEYFYKKHFDRFKIKAGVAYPKSVAILLFAFIELYVFFVRPLPVFFARVARGKRG